MAINVAQIAQKGAINEGGKNILPCDEITVINIS